MFEARAPEALAIAVRAARAWRSTTSCSARASSSATAAIELVIANHAREITVRGTCVTAASGR